ncbi:flagellar basal-body rod protein FlgF [Desulfosalsimonas propionicica]|uniref:Flagellar basal-body rod protein FlgF n=1 Tax=Desulfosalsimonas propionicica TaxID=332175 RepID=A0A7W0C8V7_9BACT|nr:flagellar basal-body rod protein FlgF [Desulfosalsimonas propionicica]MBA2881321.1 flagellar basal-body rod protein FlgF [Desulfosalsimonas propionicica]
MGSGIYSALSGGIARMQKMETSINNLANAGNIGYKASQLSFESLINDQLQNGSGKGMNYCRTASRYIDFSQGPLVETSRSLDLAIEGEGFFKVAGEDGFFYTRQGNFRLDGEGNLVTATGGLQLVGGNGPVNLPHNDVNIDEKGQITADGVQIGQVDIYGISDIQSLNQRPDGLFALDGDAQEQPAADGARLHQGSLEHSNVSVMRMTTQLIETQRAYSAYLNTMKLYSDLGEKAREIGRIG